MKAKIVNKGGEGSGNFGHEGRPGEVGGSGGGTGETATTSQAWGDKMPASWSISKLGGNPNGAMIERTVTKGKFKYEFSATIMHGTEERGSAISGKRTVPYTKYHLFAERRTLDNRRAGGAKSTTTYGYPKTFLDFVDEFAAGKASWSGFSMG